MTCSTSTIDALFRKRVAPDEAHALYAHLDTCADCRDRYDRELLFQSLLPREEQISAEDRIRATLPFSRKKQPRRFIAGFAALAVATTIALLVRPHSPGDDEQFHARGVAATGPALEMYRLHAGGAPERAPASIARGDELAFAYTNPTNEKYLAVFAVDDERNVYWYYPAWTNAAETPSSIPIRSSTGLVELGEGVKHDFAGHHARIYAVWSDAPLTTRAIEEQLAERTPLAEHLGLPNTAETSRALEIR